MKAITFLCLYLILSAPCKAQRDISNIYLELAGDSVKVSGMNSPVFGTLLYSKEKKKIITRDNPLFATDRSLVFVRPLIRITKTSTSTPQKLNLSILLFIMENEGGKLQRTILTTQFEVKNQTITEITKKLGIEDKYTIADDGMFKQILRIEFDKSDKQAIYTDEIRESIYLRLNMQGVKITVQDGQTIE